MNTTASKIIELANRTARLVEFASLRDLRIEEKNQRPQNNIRRGLGVGYLAGSPISGVVNAVQYKRAGQVYRKRDALKDAAAGTGVGVAAGVGGAIALRKPLMKQVTSQKFAEQLGDYPGSFREIPRSMGRFYKGIAKTPIGALYGISIAGAGAGYLTSRAMAKHRLRRLQETQGQ